MVSTSGFILGLIGGLLDFASASMLLIGQTTTMGIVEGTTSSEYLWAGILIALGALVILTTILSVSTFDSRIIKLAPFLMIAYGFIMLVIGTAMSGGYIPNAAMSQLYSYGMVLVGVLMVANGIVMLRGPSPMGTV